VSDYVLDSNPFIEAKNRYYGFDICPGFWTSLVDLHKENRVVSIDRVKTELMSHDDEIHEWIRDRAPATFFNGTDDLDVINAFQAMIRWVSSENFHDSAKAEFASVADGWVLAYAKVNRLVVVTHEAFAPDAKNKVPMPNLCVKFDIEYHDTFEMLRDLGEKFVRSTKRRIRKK
jgi:hypothetical protein